MFDHEFAGRLAGIVIVCGFIRLIYASKRGITDPSPTSWFLWTVEGTIFLVAYKFFGAEATLVTAWVYFLGPLAVVYFTKRNGGKILGKKLDRACFAIALGSVIPWLWIGNLGVTIGILIVIDFVAAVPSIQHVLTEPKREDLPTWILFLIGDIINVFAVREFSWADWAEVAYAVELVACSATIVGLQLRARLIRQT